MGAEKQEIRAIMQTYWQTGNQTTSLAHQIIYMVNKLKEWIAFPGSKEFGLFKIVEAAWHRKYVSTPRDLYVYLLFVVLTASGIN